MKFSQKDHKMPGPKTRPQSPKPNARSPKPKDLQVPVVGENDAVNACVNGQAMEALREYLGNIRYRV